MRLEVCELNHVEENGTKYPCGKTFPIVFLSSWSAVPIEIKK